MEKTRYAHLAPSEQSRGADPPPVAWAFPEDAARVDLPPAVELDLPPLDFRALVTDRRSVRRYAATPLSLDELSFLLWCTQGVKQAGSTHTLRTVPSAGARHALETLLLINRAEDVTPGLYGYEALPHCLVRLGDADGLDARLAEACCGQDMVANSAVSFFWVAVPYRCSWRYSDRAYRYLHLDAGHVCQNLYLASEAIGCGACAVAAFHDDQLIEVLELNPEEAFVIYVATVGKRPAVSA